MFTQLLQSMLEGTPVMHLPIKHIKTLERIGRELSDIQPLPGDKEGWKISMRFMPNGAPSFQCCSHAENRTAKLGAVWILSNDLDGDIRKADLQQPGNADAQLCWIAAYSAEDGAEDGFFTFDTAREAFQHLLQWFYAQSKEAATSDSKFAESLRERLLH